MDINHLKNVKKHGSLAVNLRVDNKKMNHQLRLFRAVCY